MELLVMAGVDISHARLLDLLKLADQAKPFYDWVETVFQSTLQISANLDSCLFTATQAEIHTAIQRCYLSSEQKAVPSLFDGAGRTYSHQKACFYFFS